MHISHNPGLRHRATTNTTSKTEAPKQETTAENLSDDSPFETVATFEFKDGGIRLQDLAGMFQKNDGGGYTLSIPTEVLTSSDSADTPPGPNSDTAAGPNGPGPGPEHVTDDAPKGGPASSSEKATPNNDGWLLA